MVEKERTLSKTERNLWNAIVAEAMAQLKYNAYSYKALEEGHPEVAQIFQEVAGAENIHGVNHLKVSGEIDSSLENLRRVVVGESKEISRMYPQYVRDALDEGKVDVAQAFILAMDRENHHLQVFSKAIEELEQKLGDRGEAPAAKTDGMAPVLEIPRLTEHEGSPTYAAARLEVEGQRWRVAAKGRIREVVFGAQDALVSTVALVTALAVANVGESGILVGGLAGALAGMMSMATGAYLGSKAEQEVQQAEIAHEAAELEDHPAEELAELVVLYQKEGLSFKDAQGVAEHIASDKDLWLRTLVEKELGLSPEMTSRPIKDALTMGAAFILAAFIPVIPYFFGASNAIIGAAIGSTLLGLFVLGVVKGRMVQKQPILQGLEVLAIGAGAAVVGFALGEGIPRLAS